MCLLERSDPLTQHTQSLCMSATFVSDKESLQVLIYGNGTAGVTQCSHSAETHAEHPSSLQRWPSINFEWPICLESKEQSRGQVLHIKYSVTG